MLSVLHTCNYKSCQATCSFSANKTVICFGVVKLGAIGSVFNAWLLRWLIPGRWAWNCDCLQQVMLLSSCNHYMNCPDNPSQINKWCSQPSGVNDLDRMLCEICRKVKRYVSWKVLILSKYVLHQCSYSSFHLGIWLDDKIDLLEPNGDFFHKPMGVVSVRESSVGRGECPCKVLACPRKVCWAWCITLWAWCAG